jgi:hypothetical protein
MILSFSETTLPAVLERRGASVLAITVDLLDEIPSASMTSESFDVVVILGEPVAAACRTPLRDVAARYLTLVRTAVRALKPNGYLIVGEDTVWRRALEPPVPRAKWIAWRILRRLLISDQLRSLPTRFLDRVDVFPDLRRPIFLLSRAAPARLKRLTFGHAGHTRWRHLVPLAFPSDSFRFAERFAGGTLHVSIKA